MLEKEKALKNKSSETLPEEKYTPDRLTRIWRQYAFQLKDEGKETFYNALVKRDPLIEKNDVLNWMKSFAGASEPVNLYILPPSAGGMRAVFATYRRAPHKIVQAHPFILKTIFLKT